ncbi:protein prenylyltransferase [Pholiota conissans]|uniref:Protein farnesyltransferase/geranylgeranyltransferase type-1 subunit alpha n=1 Tax=Pholiota conissans TaxID=109636 RepID=A0A9P5ZFV3_9AGAR|nr:protein prenylyltransferase [Pholiota conissans]
MTGRPPADDRVNWPQTFLVPAPRLVYNKTTVSNPFRPPGEGFPPFYIVSPSRMPSTTDEDVPLFAEREDWADVQPLEQYEGANPIASIFYTAEYKDATNYFRAIVKSGEKSPRVLELTENIIRQNPAHYSAWQYRYETLLALLPEKFDETPPLLTSELRLMDELAVQFLKTYQVWHHRRLLVPLAKQPMRELAFIKRSLEVDAKNYHTWSYRQWLLASCYGLGAAADEANDDSVIDDAEEVWAGELDFVDAMLSQDVRNNSAWHHRFFVVYGCRGLPSSESERQRIFKRELIYTKQNISLAPSNPSAWNYLRGILKETGNSISVVKHFARLYAFPHGSNEKHDIVDLDNPPPSAEAELPSVQAMEFLADVWEAEAIAKLKTEPKAAKTETDKAVEMWTALANEHDKIRKKYWEHRIRDAHHLLQASA